ncbi:MAG: hypothetical protein AAFN18_14845 [Cyanobacteria bacterium J06554_6]
MSRTGRARVNSAAEVPWTQGCGGLSTNVSSFDISGFADASCLYRERPARTFTEIQIKKLAPA